VERDPELAGDIEARDCRSCAMSDRKVCVAWLAALLAGVSRFGAPADAQMPSLQVGTMTLHPCATAGAWCGSFMRALDPAGTVPDLLPIYFEFYPHTDSGPSKGTLVATEGGPGFPATETRGEYLALYAPLRASRDVLIMDNRGTGHSGAIDCPALQTSPMLTLELVAACGRQLGARAPLYSTALAADDLAALIDRLGAAPVDLYGDSYGTFFAQVFALRHPAQLRSLVLDGAYPLGDSSYAWYPAYAPAMRDKFNLACERSAACSALPGDSISHIQPALRELRLHPAQAEARDVTGRLHRFRADATALAIVMFGAAPARATVREVDAAARAYAAGDRQPLFRLIAETIAGVDSRDATQSPQNFSAGLAAAVMCQDAPQIYDMRLAPALRMADRDRAIAQRKAAAPESYAPFTIDEYRRMPIDYSFLDECVQWPTSPPAYPAGRIAAADAPYPNAPTLVVSGDLDNMTPVADGAAAARNFPHGRQLLLRNALHVNALPHSRSDCGAILVRRFIETLDPGDTSCAEAIPELRLVPRFARALRDLPPAEAQAGNAARELQLRAVTAAVLAVGDALIRAPEIGSGDGIGLRSGSFSVGESKGGYHLTLRQIRWTEDLRVSGTVDAPRRDGAAHAQLQLRGAGDVSGTLSVDWHEGVSKAQAKVHGTLGGRAVAALLDAP
jgi:pimeloyl-ACP methyl ester carboxylesterase